MSKRAKKKARRLEGMVAKHVSSITPEEKLLDKMLACDTTCTDIGKFERTKKVYIEDFVEWLISNLPTVPYVRERKVNMAFSNKLTTGNEKEDEILDKFLFAQNVKGVTNYSVLRENYDNSEVFGKDGLRWLGEDGIINVPSKYYASLVEDNEEHYGFKDTVAYLVSTDGRKMWEADTKRLKFDKEAFESKGVIIDKEKHMMIISPDEFLNVRNDISNEEGKSPFLDDQLRLSLLTAILERLNYDIEYDGPGRIIVRVDDDYANGKGNEISATNIINDSERARVERESKIKQEVANIGEQIKSSSSDNIIMLSNAFKEKIDHLPRVTKATEFLQYLEKEGEIISQVLKVTPLLIGFGKISGNVSMEKIIDNAMLTDVIPDREDYINKVSAWLAPKIGVSKIYFDKYEMKQVVDENDKRKKVVEMVEKLRKTGNQTDAKAADALVEMLTVDLKGGNGELKKLSFINKTLENVKKLFTKEEERRK